MVEREAEQAARVELPDNARPTSLGHLPEGQRWEFDSDVTNVFEDMLARSIPQYDVMRRAVTDVASEYAVRGTAIVDLGSSRGDAVEPLIRKFGAHLRYHLCEASEPMLDVLRERFASYIDGISQLVYVHDCDLRDSFPRDKTSVVLSVLCLQFTPIEYRQQIVQRAYDVLLPGGAFVVVEKLLGASAEIDDVLVKMYLRMKSEGGYSQEEIDRKRLSLEGVLVPVTAAWNEELLRMAGFRYIDCFWRWMNFGAWLAVK
jgi:tRNA (cmo5U34)-methyltransferase